MNDKVLTPNKKLIANISRERNETYKTSNVNVI